MICIKKGNESHAYDSWFNFCWIHLFGIPQGINKIQLSVENGLCGIVNMTNVDIPAEVPLGGDQLISATLTNYGIPITGSLAAGFVIGFMKGWLMPTARTPPRFIRI
jgi:hypothetical protein